MQSTTSIHFYLLFIYGTMSWSVHHALMPHKHTHRTCSIAVAVAVVVFVALTFMLIANGVTNIIHWIRIRNSILSWEFQS